MERIIIFGASIGGLKAYHTLKSIGLDIEFFVDNDRAKQGYIYENKPVKGPDALIDLPTDYRIVIASTYHSEIKQQLYGMDISDDKIILKEKYLLKYIDENVHTFEAFSINHNVMKTKRKIYIDIADGLTLGGIEKWSITVAQALEAAGRDAILLTNRGEYEVTNQCSHLLQYYDLSVTRYMQSVHELAREMISQLPCTVIANRITQVFMAAYLVKQIYGDRIRIISVLHSDFERTYEQNKLIEETVDAFLCVSDDVRNKFVKKYHVKNEKVYVKDSPVKVNKEQIRTYSSAEEPMVLGYAGRLEKAQKRTDLLLPLIERLEELRLDYCLKIAGDGSYYDKLSNYIERQGLKGKIRLYGTIPFDQMNDFWSTCDVMLNLSDLEGIGLSMLEAMAAGTVPVVTDTAGAKSFIDNGINGYINPCGDVNSIADKVRLLYENRDKLLKFGSISKERIESKCDPTEYIHFLSRLIDGEVV